MRRILSLITVLFYLIGNTHGKGDSAPTYQEDPQTKALKNQVYGQVSGIFGTPYQDLVNRFTPSQDNQNLINNSLNQYQDLIKNTDYSTGDYTQTRDNYLKSILGTYNDQRTKDLASQKESLIANNLLGSGPGYDILNKFSQDTAKGAGDIASTWAYNNINTDFQQKSYEEALQRGDYTTMYNLALNKANQEVAPQVQATATQFQGAGAGLNLLSQLNTQDQQKYQNALEQYKVAQQSGGDFGGLGTALGLGVGALLAPATGGLSLAIGAGIGGGIGGGLGSMIKY